MNAKAMSLKARIRNLAKAKKLTVQVLLQNYMFEAFLDRLSRSEHKDKFVLKGGVLIASIVGQDNRSTMDLDTTLRNLKLTEETVSKVISEICSISSNDAVVFSIVSIHPIRHDDIYGGLRVALLAQFDQIETPLSIDVTTGDVITPKAVKIRLSRMFDERKQIELWAYNIETVMAEKLETILRRNIFNTRARDFYDIHILSTTQTFNLQLLGEAVAATAAHRGTSEQIKDTNELLKIIAESQYLQDMWKKYQRQFSYATDIGWDQIIQSLGTCLSSK